MKKYVIFVLNVIVLFSITNVYAEEAVTEIKTVEDKVGWVTENGNTYYYENNQKVSGFKTIDNKLYFFSRVNYALKKGWQNAKEGKWYQNSNGEVVKGLQTIDKNKYYFNDNGIMQTGFITLNNCDLFNLIFVSFEELEQIKLYFFGLTFLLPFLIKFFLSL